MMGVGWGLGWDGAGVVNSFGEEGGESQPPPGPV